MCGAELGGLIDLTAILEFIDSGRNVVFAGGSETAKLTRELGAQNAITFDAPEKVVIDHMNFHPSDSSHTLVYCSSFVPDFLVCVCVFCFVLFCCLGALTTDDHWAGGLQS